MRVRWAIPLLLGATAFAAGALVDQPRAAQAQNVQEAPPPPQIENPGPPPSGEAVWISGHWVWRDGTYSWIRGRWETPPPGQVYYYPGRWKRTQAGWVWEPGGWRR